MAMAPMTVAKILLMVMLTGQVQAKRVQRTNKIGKDEAASHANGAEGSNLAIEGTSRTKFKAGAKSLVVAGSVFAGRFRMEQSMWHETLARSTKKIPLPGLVTKQFSKTEYIFAGSFGEVWQAVDTATGKRVAVKMFYSKQSHLTWEMAKKDENLAKQLKDAASECKVAFDMQAYADEDPKGASRIMQCIEDHVTLGTSVTGHTVCKSDPLFQVLEFAGTTTLTDWLKKQRWRSNKYAAEYLTRVLGVFRQLIEGLHYLMSHEKKWVHHDIKPDNIVIKEAPDGTAILKLIDFGSVRQVSRETAAEPTASTPFYAPPEFFDYSDMLHGKSVTFATGYNFDAPWSFDVYSAAMLLDEFTTGMHFFTKLEHRLSSSGPSSGKVEDCLKALLIWNVVKAGVPRHQAERQSKHSLLQKYFPYNHYAVARQLKGDCVTHLTINDVKKPHGLEHDVTKNFGNDDNASDFALKALLFGSGNNSDRFNKVIEIYKQVSQDNDWFKMYMKMIAFDATARAKPEEILASKLLKDRETSMDPDFVASYAKERSDDPAAGTMNNDSRDPTAAQCVGGAASTSLGMVVVALALVVDSQWRA